jgi:hypothetical protein
VLGTDWSLVVTRSNVELLPEDITYGKNKKRAILAEVEVELSCRVDGTFTQKAGVGADFGAVDDPDKVLKTAFANAVKKAGNLLGIALYLWLEDERELLEVARAVAEGDSATLKNVVRGIARVRLGKTNVSAEEAAEVFGLDTPGALADFDTLVGIIKAEGILDGYSI